MMGYSLTTVPDGPGAVAAWGAPGTLAGIRSRRQLVDAWHAYMDGLNAARATTYYIDQGTNNAAAGTDPANPRLCATTTDVRNFIAATVGSGNVRYRLRRGKTWNADASNQTGIEIADDDVTLDSYLADGDPEDAEAPLFSGEKAAYGAAGWTNVTGNVYSRTDANASQILWITAGATLEDKLRNDYTKATSQLDCQAKAGSFFVTGTTLYVHERRSGDRSIAQAIVAFGIGVDVRDNDNVVVEGINFLGWGTGSGFQWYCGRTQASGSKCTMFRRCGFYYGMDAHAAGHYNDTGSAGGITVWLSNRLGLSTNEQSGAGGTTILNSFASAGGHEFLAADNEIVGGELRYSTTSAVYNGTGIYGHTGTGSFALIVLDSNTATDHPTCKLKALDTFGNVPAPSDPDDWTAYACFVRRSIMEYPAEPSAGSLQLLPNAVREGCLLRLKAPSSFAASAFSLSAETGILVNNVLLLDYSGTTQTPVGFVNANAASHIVALHNLVVADLAPGQTFKFDWDAVASGFHASWIGRNNVFVRRGGTKAYPAWPNNANSSHNAYYAMESASDGDSDGYDQTEGAVTLVGTAPRAYGCDPRLAGRGAAADELAVDVDFDGRRRPAAPAIGPWDTYEDAMLVAERPVGLAPFPGIG